MARVVMNPAYGVLVENASADEVHAIARDIGRDIRSNIRSGRHVETGALVRSVRVRRLANRRSRIYIGTDHWWYIEYGTGPHVLVAEPGQVFRFVKANGEVVFTKRIRHPGNPAYMVVRRAVFKYRRHHG
jgi:hypothetical protein